MCSFFKKYKLPQKRQKFTKRSKCKTWEKEDNPGLVRLLEAFTTIRENALLWIVQQLNLKGPYAPNQNPFKCVVGQSGSFDISVSSEESRGTGVV